MKRSKYNKGKKAPAFIMNLFKILQQSENHAYICWRSDQQSFIITNVPKFSQIVLPKYYKHSNYSSFVRQLNMYNFSKLRSQYEREHIFQNQLFTKNGYDNLRNIKRREVVSNKNNNILTLANNLNSQINSQSNEISVEQNSLSNYQQNQMVQLAAPSPNMNYFDFPSFDGLKLSHSISEYLFQTQKMASSIPPIIPLKYEQIQQPIKCMIDQMKSSQNQLQQVCLGLYKQNEFLNTQNKRLQQKLKTEYKKKQQILNQIIKYVVSFLSQWNNSAQMGEQKDFYQQRGFQDDESSSDIILQSYDMFQNRTFQKNKKYSQKNKMFQQRYHDNEKSQTYSSKSDKKSFSFSKYAKNQKKLLLTLLKQIQKSYNQKFFYTGSNIGSNYQFGDSKPQFNYPSNSANGFLMSMLLKFIQSNNLTQVIKRFSLLINLQRNKKSKNFTVVNCMKDLTQHFNLIGYQKQDILKAQDIVLKKERSLLKERNLKYVNKQKYLQNQKYTINQMQKQLDLIKKQRNKNLMIEQQEMMNHNYQISSQSGIVDSIQSSNSSYSNSNQLYINFFERRSSLQVQKTNEYQKSNDYGQKIQQKSQEEQLINKKLNEIVQQKFNFKTKQ